MSVDPIPPPEWIPPDPHRLPALRENLADQMRNPIEHAQLTILMDQGRGTVNPRPSDPAGGARLLLDDERRRLESAHLFSVTADMTELARRAGAQLPNWEVRRSDIPANSGLMVFGEPIGTYISDFQNRTIEIVAVSWGPTMFSDAEDQSLWLTFWSVTDFDAMTTSYMETGMSRTEARSMAYQARADLCWDNESVLSYDSDQIVIHGNQLVDTSRTSMATETTAPWVNVVRAAWLLMRQDKMTEATQEPQPRTVRRRSERRGYDTSPVTVIHLHRSRHRPAPAGGSAHGGKHSVQYPVSGHWRQQPYPATETVKRIWIDGHWRGPEGAPVKINKEWKVSLLDRPPPN